LLRYIEWKPEDVGVYLVDMTFLGTLADLQFAFLP
jgi:hypothetical protein